MNKVLLSGRLTKDPNVNRTQGQNPTAIARFALAVDRRKAKNADSQTADFPNIVCFGKTAEFVERYLHKGSKILLEGRIQTGSYTNQQGVKVYTTDVVAENVEFAESKGQNAGYAPQNGYAAPPAPQPAQAPQYAAPPQGYVPAQVAPNGYVQPVAPAPQATVQAAPPVQGQPPVQQLQADPNAPQFI